MQHIAPFLVAHHGFFYVFVYFILFTITIWVLSLFTDISIVSLSSL